MEIWCWHHIRVLAYVATPPCLIQLPAHSLGRAVEDDPSAKALAADVGGLDEVVGSRLLSELALALLPTSIFISLYKPNLIYFIVYFINLFSNNLKNAMEINMKI